MGWFSNTLDAIREQTKHEPTECPRGWGPVSFVASVWLVPPLFGIDRKCPIGGVGECGACNYAANPDAFRLADQLAELVRLRGAEHLSADEYERRRRAIVHLHSTQDLRRRMFHTAAWVMIPLGTLITAAGFLCVTHIHPGFWGLVALGAVLIVIGASCWGLSRAEFPPPDANSGS